MIITLLTCMVVVFGLDISYHLKKETSDSSDPEILECTLVLEIVESALDSKKVQNESSHLNTEDTVKSILNDIIKNVVVEKVEKKSVSIQPKKNTSSKKDAFSRGGYVKRRRKPREIQESSSSESEV